MERWLVLKNQDTTTCTIYNISGPKMAKNGGPLTAVSQERNEFGASLLHFGLCAFEAPTLHKATPMPVPQSHRLRGDRDNLSDLIKLEFMCNDIMAGLVRRETSRRDYE